HAVQLVVRDRAAELRQQLPKCSARILASFGGSYRSKHLTKLPVVERLNLVEDLLFQCAVHGGSSDSGRSYHIEPLRGKSSGSLGISPAQLLGFRPDNALSRIAPQ